MPHAFLFASDTNPNDNTGGGGCVCSPEKQIDCVGPYVCFPGNDLENIASPNVVIGIRCIEAALHAATNTKEVFSAGEGGSTTNLRDTLPVPVGEDVPEL